MSAHKSHDWSPLSWTCIECGTGFHSIDAGYKCRPSTDDSAEVVSEIAKPAVEIDYSSITRGFAT